MGALRLAAIACVFALAGCHGQRATELPPLQWCGAGGRCYRYIEDAGMWFEDCPIKRDRGRLVNHPAIEPSFVVTGPAHGAPGFLVTDPGFLATDPPTKGTNDDHQR